MGAADIESFGRAVDRGLANSDRDQDRRWWLSVYQDSGEIKSNEENAGCHFKVRGAAVGMYGEYKTGAFRLSSLAAYGKSVYDSERRVNVGSGADVFQRAASGRFNGYQWLVTVRGERFGERGAAVLEPIFGVTWLSVSRDAFAASGADEGDLALDRYSTNYLRGDLGLRLRLQPVTTGSGGMVQRTLWTAYVHDFTLPARSVTAYFRDNPDHPMTIQGVERTKGAFRVGLELAGLEGGQSQRGWRLRYEGGKAFPRGPAPVRAKETTRVHRRGTPKSPEIPGELGPRRTKPRRRDTARYLGWVRTAYGRHPEPCLW